MSWQSDVLQAYRDRLGEPARVHSVPSDGGPVNVAEFPLDDDTVAYATAGLSSEGGGFQEWELVLHAAKPDDSHPKFLTEMAAPVRKARPGEVIAVDGEFSYAGIGVFWVTRLRDVGGGMVGLRQVAGLTDDELAVARRDALETVEAAWWRDGVGRMIAPGRPTSPSLTELTPVRPDPGQLAGLNRTALQVMEYAIHVDHDGAEGIRGRFGKGDAARLASLLAERLPHPAQLACLLHALMDFAIPELAPVCLRLLQLSPTHEMARQYYADALGMLASIEGSDWGDAYFRYESDFDAACQEAERRRAEAGLEIEFGRPANPFAR